MFQWKSISILFFKKKDQKFKKIIVSNFSQIKKGKAVTSTVSYSEKRSKLDSPSRLLSTKLLEVNQGWFGPVLSNKIRKSRPKDSGGGINQYFDFLNEDSRKFFLRSNRFNGWKQMFWQIYKIFEKQVFFIFCFYLLKTLQIAYVLENPVFNQKIPQGDSVTKINF